MKGDEQGENSIVGNTNRKRVHIDTVGDKIRNRKEYAQQYRKRKGFTDIVST